MVLWSHCPIVPWSLILILALPLFFLFAEPAPQGDLFSRAEQQFQQKNYKDARALYEKFIEQAPKHEKVQVAVNQVLACRLRMGEFAEALEFARGRIEKDKGSVWEARSYRRYGNLLMSAPHWGTRRGGKFHRAERTQGEYVNSFRKDRKEAIQSLEAARTIYFRYVEQEAKEIRNSKERNPNEAPARPPVPESHSLLLEALQCDFDLAGAILRRREYAQSWDWWDDFSEQDEEIEDYEPGYGYRRRRVMGSVPPAGLRVDKEGNPIFTKTPESYDAKLPDDQKARYLLKEVEAKDSTKNHELKALAIYRRAMVARARFGPDRVVRWWQYGHRQFGPLGQPKQDDPNKPEKELWELKENEALTWVAGELKVIPLPREEDVAALLSEVGHEYADTAVAPEALYALGAFFQSRQQYPRALEAYGEFLARFPRAPQRYKAESARRQIQNPEVQLHQIGAQLAGRKAKLELSYRNVDHIRFKVQPIDLPGLLGRIRELDGKVWDYSMGQKDFNGLPVNVQQLVNPYNLVQFLLDARFNRYRNLLTGQPIIFEASVPDDGTLRPARTTVEAPVTEGACYFVEATVPGRTTPSRSFFIVSDLVILEKNIANKRLYYLANAITGAPVGNAEFVINETWVTNRKKGKLYQSINHVIVHPSRTNDAGLFELSLPRINRSRNLHAVAYLPAEGAGPGAPKTRFAFTQMSYWYPSDPSWRWNNQHRIFAFTDRPVYRPEDTVHFKIWIRQRRGGAYASTAGLPLQVEIYDAKNSKLATYNPKTDEHGAAEGKLVLGEEPPLGMYRIAIHFRGRAYGNASFRVEEYKKPEFEVTVKPGARHARLGQPITAVIEARYYFGAPVTEGTVKYKVFRQAFQHQYIPPGRYDWLYGPGYGILDYPYEWFPWWKRWGFCRIAPPWYHWRPAAARQLVKHGEAEIGKDGKLEIKIETADALKHHGDSDHRYIIQAEVTDASRRTITGAGSVNATRQSFYAYINTDRGWLRPKEQATFEIITRTPDNTPVSAKGKLIISEVKYQGRRNEEIIEKVFKEFELETDETGKAELPMRFERSGQYRISFRTADPWGGEVQGNAVLWVAGDTFAGKLYRFNDLEVLTDKREYQAGEVAHVLINVAEAGSYVLFSPDGYGGVIRNYRLLHLPQKSKVIDIPIKSRHEPNFYIEATTIRNGKVHQQMREVAVPAARHFLDVQIRPDKPTYQPGATGSLILEVKDHTGKPAQTELALAAFDQSILYIQPELAPKIEQVFYGQKRHHNLYAMSSLQWFFQARGGHVSNPSWPSQSRDWWGYWGPAAVYWPEATAQQIKAMMSGNFRQEGAKKSRRLSKSRAPQAAGMVAMEKAADAAAPMAPAKAEAKANRRKDQADKNGAGGSGGESFAEAQVRSDFADTALWAPQVVTDAQGRATVPIHFPESLTTWKINAWGLSASTQVGQASTSAITTKNLLVRLQAPRFFVERDEVVLSANVHNYLKTAKKVKVSIELPEKILARPGQANPRMIEVSAAGEKRVDWRVKVLHEGLAEITVKALTNEESDAMKLAFPVFVHGIEKQIAQVGSMAPNLDRVTQEYSFTIPEARKPEATTLSIKVAPSLAGAMLDALPYLIDYPYGCIEQTMSRFLPAVVTRKMLQDTGMNLEAIAEKRKELPTTAPDRMWGYWRSPVFDTKELNKIIQAGLKRVLDFQQPNGGWGWWGNSRASVYQTCYVVYGLITARDAGVKIDPNIIQRGLNYLENNLEDQYGEFKKGIHTGHAYACYVLALGGRNKNAWLDTLFKKRDRLNNYGKALLCLTYHQAGNDDRARLLLRNIEQYLQQDDENETAWLKTPRQGWWWWWNNDIETSAWLVRCYAALEPRSAKPRRVVKWLLNNRRHGYYWNSTRDTAMTVLAFADFMKASGELRPEYELTVAIDRGVLGKKTFRVTPANMFFFDNVFEISGAEIGAGKHTVQVTKKGKGAAYLSTIATFFTKEEDIQGAGLELKIDRRYYKLVPKVKSVDVTTATGGKVAEQFAKYDRVPMKTGDVLASGDLLEVELMITSKNDYDYLVFEDMKPAGCEAVELRSGGSYQEGLVANMELRDEKVAFFIGLLHQGTHRLRYRLRAEIPGHFHALPTKGYAMYAPDIYGTSDEMRVNVKDK